MMGQFKRGLKIYLLVSLCKMENKRFMNIKQMLYSLINSQEAILISEEAGMYWHTSVKRSPIGEFSNILFQCQLQFSGTRISMAFK